MLKLTCICECCNSDYTFEIKPEDINNWQQYSNNFKIRFLENIFIILCNECYLNIACYYDKYPDQTPLSILQRYSLALKKQKS